MSFDSLPRNRKRVRAMKILEKELYDLRLRINMYASIHQQSSKKLEAFRTHYEGLLGDGYRDSIMEDFEYLRAMERMKMAEQQLEALELERRELLKKVTNFMR